ncbi:MAG TPA: TolC family protein [Polyangia bacterium]|jgi:outer membrane protein TolC
MPRASRLVAIVTLVGGAASAQPLPKVQPQPSSMTPAQAMQADSLSPELPAAEVLGFEAAINRSFAKNPSAAVALDEIARARAIVEEVRAASLPTLALNGAYTRVEQTRVLAGTSTVVVPADQVNASLFFSAPLVAPSRWVQTAHAKDNVDVSRLSAEDVRRQLATATGRTFLQVMTQHKAIEVARRARDNARAHYQFAHQRFAGGYGTRVDEVRAAQEVASDEAQLQASVANLARLREALGVLVGEDHPIDVPEDVTLPGAPALEQSLKDAAELRSDVVLFRGRLKAAEHVKKDDWADYTPSLLLTLQPFFQYPPTSQLPEWGFQGQLLLSWTIYDGGLRYGLAKERAALVREAQASLDGGVRQARSDVRTADEEVRRAAAALKAARDAAKLAGEGLSLTNLAYRAGASTNIEVIDAERVARDADSAVAQAEDAWRQATLDMLLASGRFPAR